MATNGLETSSSPYQRLEWESNHFGVDAASLGDATLDDDQLAAALRQVRNDGIQLLVWPASADRNVSQEVLDEFGGILVDRKVTFSRSLAEEGVACDLAYDSDLNIFPCEPATATSALYELAIASGEYSRFAVDPHFKRERFEAMYRRWIDRSVNRELADAVLVATLAGNITGGLAGMITLAESRGVASIGLVAVAAEMRGRGIGSALMRAADRWMRRRNAREARVVTQMANTPACRLYERSGYMLLKVQHYYHFWPTVQGRQTHAQLRGATC